MEPPGGLNGPHQRYTFMDDADPLRSYKDLKAFPQLGTLDGYILPNGAGPCSKDQDQPRRSRLVPVRPAPPPPTKVKPPSGPAPPPVPPRTRGPFRRQLSSVGRPVPARRLIRSASQVDTYVSNSEKVLFCCLSEDEELRSILSSLPSPPPLIRTLSPSN